MTESTLRAEITRRAPHLKILRVGQLFGDPAMDAIVEDSRGQCLWSVYARELDPQPIAQADQVPTGQGSLF